MQKTTRTLSHDRRQTHKISAGHKRTERIVAMTNGVRERSAVTKTRNYEAACAREAEAGAACVTHGTHVMQVLMQSTEPVTMTATDGMGSMAASK
jgi:hypothetical protein